MFQLFLCGFFIQLHRRGRPGRKIGSGVLVRNLRSICVVYWANVSRNLCWREAWEEDWDWSAGE